MTKPDPRSWVMRWLARREYSVKQLQDKLLAKGVELDLAEKVLAEFKAKNWQSDARYAEHYIRHRINLGFGPIGIAHKLQQQGVAETVISEQIAAAEVDWQQLAHQVFNKKFPADFLQGEHYLGHLAKVQRFLHQRGFGPGHIKKVVAVAKENVMA